MARRAPIVPLAVAFGAGMAVGPVAPVAAGGAVWAVAVAAGGVLVAFARPAVATVAVLLAVGAVGALRGSEPPVAADHVSRLALPRSARVEARLVDEPTRWTAERARLMVEVERVDGESRSGA